LRILVVAGARPNFVKIAPILSAAAATGVDFVLVHTGQHYDADMSDSFFRDLRIPDPHYHLGVGSGTQAVQTARVMEAFEPVLLKERPDWVVVVGDVTSTLAAALVTAKLKVETGSRLAHVEAGLRSGDWRMPEEVNRVLTDRIADLLLTPSTDAKLNLIAEGIPDHRIRFVGNVMIDTLLEQLPKARNSNFLKAVGVTPGEYVAVTLHRPSNVDDPTSLEIILTGLQRISRDAPVIFPMHPRTRRRATEQGFAPLLKTLTVLDPLGYHDMLALTDAALMVMTDSGGLQEESTVLGVPCITLRESTERPVTITDGTNQLIPWPLTALAMFDAFDAARHIRRVPAGERCPQGWDGKTAPRILQALGEHALTSRP
jgi:UDP-N-acetylglucosamine 2-epimerase (non-hydrolysing)